METENKKYAGQFTTLKVGGQHITVYIEKYDTPVKIALCSFAFQSPKDHHNRKKGHDEAIGAFIRGETIRLPHHALTRPKLFISALLAAMTYHGHVDSESGRVIHSGIEWVNEGIDIIAAEMMD
jgi:hypothetical protein